MKTTIELMADDRTLPHPERYQLAFNGTEVPWTKVLSYTASLDLKQDEFLVDRIDQLKLRRATTCGQEELPVELSWKTKDTEKRARTERTSKAPTALLSLAGKPLLDRVVYLDNAGGPATEVTIGSQRHSVKTGEVKKLELVGGTCEGALSVKRNGKAVAELPGKPTLRQNQAAPAVIDVTGKHCYALRKVIYVTSGNDAKHLKREAPRPLEEARIVEAPDVRYVLEPVPDTVKTPMAGALTHTALEHRSCR